MPFSLHEAICTYTISGGYTIEQEVEYMIEAIQQPCIGLRQFRGSSRPVRRIEDLCLKAEWVAGAGALVVVPAADEPTERHFLVLFDPPLEVNKQKHTVKLTSRWPGACEKKLRRVNQAATNDDRWDSNIWQLPPTAVGAIPKAQLVVRIAKELKGAYAVRIRTKVKGFSDTADHVLHPGGERVFTFNDVQPGDLIKAKIRRVE
jgi:hypothetical protein